MINKFRVVVWNIGFLDKSASELIKDRTGNININWMKHKYKDRFFADPFMLEISDEYYVILAEEYLFSERLGKIVKLFVNKNTYKLEKRELLIESQYHLSYPIVYNNKVFPEQSKSGNWFSYSLDSLQKKRASNFPLVDATFLNDEYNWVFATKKDLDKFSPEKKLYRYQLDKNDCIIESSELLIKDNFSNSRPAGNFFKIDNKLYRPAQNSNEQTYGDSITINEVEVNNIKEYKEKEILTINSHNEKKYNLGLHTFNVFEDKIVVDGFQMEFHPIYKLLYHLNKRRKND